MRRDTAFEILFICGVFPFDPRLRRLRRAVLAVAHATGKDCMRVEKSDLSVGWLAGWLAG